jgi:glycine/D-amino acid oxidase-like deaminating enzyme
MPVAPERLADAVLGATFTPHCARVHPRRLVDGLAGAVRRRGGRIVEGRG